MPNKVFLVIEDTHYLGGTSWVFVKKIYDTWEKARDYLAECEEENRQDTTGVVESDTKWAFRVKGPEHNMFSTVYYIAEREVE